MALPTGFKIKTFQDVRTLWYDVSFEGEHWARFDSLTSALAYVFDGIEEGGTFPCGCNDYHYADCPTRGGI